jgi:hypothetical protein
MHRQRHIPKFEIDNVNDPELSGRVLKAQFARAIEVASRGFTICLFRFAAKVGRYLDELDLPHRSRSLSIA